MKKSSVVLVVVLMVAIVAAVSITFAVWDNSTDTDSGIGASIGSNVYVSIKDITPFKELNKQLLPDGAIRGANDVYAYTGATFSVMHRDASSKSTLRIKLSVTTDGKLDVTSFFDLQLQAVTDGASVTMDSNNGNVGTIVVPLDNIGGEGNGLATFSLGMSFKDNATDIVGFDTIIGRKFNIKIDITAN